MFVYLITNTVTGDTYVGQTIRTIEDRFYHHKWRAKNETANIYLYNAMRKYGIEKFTVEEIDVASSRDTLNEKERHWISKLSPTYNMTEGGEGGSTNKGRKFSQDHRKKISVSLTGKKASKEHIENAAMARSKTYQFLDPNGNPVTIKNLAKYCREHNLNQGHMVGLYRGRYGVASHKGYTRLKSAGEPASAGS